MQVSAPIALTERHEIRVRDVGTSNWSWAIGGDRDKRMTLVFDSRLGAGRDRIRLTANDIPMPGTPGLEMNLNPGLGGIEIITQGSRVEVSVVVQTQIDGRLQERRFRVPFEGGVRVRLSSVLSTGTLSIGQIPRLFGPASSKMLLRPQ